MDKTGKQDSSEDTQKCKSICFNPNHTEYCLNIV